MWSSLFRTVHAVVVMPLILFKWCTFCIFCRGLWTSEQSCLKHKFPKMQWWGLYCKQLVFCSPASVQLQQCKAFHLICVWFLLTDHRQICFTETHVWSQCKTGILQHNGSAWTTDVPDIMCQLCETAGLVVTHFWNLTNCYSFRFILIH